MQGVIGKLGLFDFMLVMIKSILYEGAGVQISMEGVIFAEKETAHCKVYGPS